MVGLLEDPDDFGLDEAQQMAEKTDQSDLVVAVDRLKEVEEADGGTEIGADEIDLPFYETEREMAFVVGLIAGAALQASE